MKGEGNMKISKKISVITLAALFSLLFAMTAFGAKGYRIKAGEGFN